MIQSDVDHLQDPRQPQSLWAFVCDRDTHKMLLEALIAGLLTGPFVGFIFSGGLADPTEFFTTWQDRWGRFLKIMFLVGAVWSVVLTFAMVMLRTCIVPYLIERLRLLPKAALITVAAVTFAGMFTSGLAMLLVQGILIKVFNVWAVPGDSVVNISGVAAVLGIIFTNLFAAFHHGDVRLFEARERAQELQRSRLEGELMNINMRIRPHFFFNTLNTLATLIDKDVDHAQEYLADLSDLFRQSFALGNAGHLCTWSEERQLLDTYIRLERNRFDCGVSLAVDAPDDALFPAFLLQPLVENAIHHGVSKIKEQGDIRLTGAFDQAQQRWTIEINNPAPPEASAEIHQGHALDVTRRRLQLMDGDLEIQLHDQRFTAKLHWRHQHELKEFP